MVAHPADHELGEWVERQLGRLAAQDVGHGHLGCTRKPPVIANALLVLVPKDARLISAPLPTVRSYCILLHCSSQSWSASVIQANPKSPHSSHRTAPYRTSTRLPVLTLDSIILVLFLFLTTHQKVGGCDRREVVVESEHDDRRKSFLGGGHPVRSFDGRWIGRIRN